MNIQEIAKNLEKKEDGYYYSKTHSNISYPKEGNDLCYQLEENSFWFNHRNNLIIDLVQKFSKQEVFFDIGGGNGFVSKGLQEAGINVVLVEPGPKGVINAQKRNIKNIIFSTLQDANFNPNTLGAVGLFDVVEHIENDYGLLNDIHGYMKNGGRLFLTIPTYRFLWSNEDIDSGHFRRYSLKKINSLLIKCGFEIEYSTYFFSILPIPIFIFRTIPSLWGFKKKSNEFSKHQKEHKNENEQLNKLLQKILNWERKKIMDLQKINFGSSCLVVARKI